MYVNYHKHTHYSSLMTADTHATVESYFQRIAELGHKVYFTTEHGFGGDIFDPFDVRSGDDKYKDIRICYGVEAYITAYKDQDVADNYHIIILARNNNARRKLNKIISTANKERFYYYPRVIVDDLLALDEDDVYITTACMGGILKEDYVVTDTRNNKVMYVGFEEKAKAYLERSKNKEHFIIEKQDKHTNEILIPLIKHFGKSLFLEVQNHGDKFQKAVNKKALEYSKKYDLEIVHANDSHYAFLNEHNRRIMYLRSKNVTYENEDDYILDYPSKEEIIERYQEQGILTKEQVLRAIENTNVFADCDEIDINKNIKMPSAYDYLTFDQRMDYLEMQVYEEFERKKHLLPKEKWKEYEDAIVFELGIVRETNDEVHTADYFLFNKKTVEVAKEKGGELTPTARGSAASFVINYFLGLTDIDRLSLDVPMYPTRFISKSRLLETRSLPDFDFDTSDPMPFVEATRQILGKHSCYPMIAYGTMQLSSAFRSYCRSIVSWNKDIKNPETSKAKVVEIADRLQVPYSRLAELTLADYGDIAKSLSAGDTSYESDPFWGKLINDSKPLINSIESCSPSPSSYLIMEEDIEEELSVIRVGNAKSYVYAVPITSMEVEVWKYLKNDFLVTNDVKIIHEVFRDLEQPILPVNDLLDLIDTKVWQLYERGITATLNQVDTDNSRRLVMQYKPKTYEELSAFIAAIRPGFASLLQGFIARKGYSTGNKSLDEVLEDTEHYLLYQESIMKYLTWLGVPEDETYGLIKRISKKSLKPDELDILHKQLESNWIEKTGSSDGFEQSWQVVEDAAEYSFNSSHSIAYAINSLYGAYLKANYPLQYYTSAFNTLIKDNDVVSRLSNELDYFGIKLSAPSFRSPSSSFSYDEETKTIYQGIASIKGIPKDLGDNIKRISKKEYEYFIDLLDDLNEIGCIKTHIERLILIDFFKELFPNQKKMIILRDLHGNFKNRKSINKDRLEEFPLIKDAIEKILEVEEQVLITETEKTYKVEDFGDLLKVVERLLVVDDYSINEKLANEFETKGSYSLTDPNVNKRMVIVSNLNTRYSPSFDGYCVNNGNSTRLKVYKNSNHGKGIVGFSEKPFEEGATLFIDEFEHKRVKRPINGVWQPVEPPEWEWWAIKYDVVE